MKFDLMKEPAKKHGLVNTHSNDFQTGNQQKTTAPKTDVQASAEKTVPGKKHGRENE